MALCINYIVCQSASKMHLLINIWLPPSALLVKSIEICQSFLIYQNHHATVLEIEGFMSKVSEQCTRYTSAFLHIQWMCISVFPLKLSTGILLES